MRAAADPVILFDLDGVLVDSRVAIAECINHALSAHGLSVRHPAELHRFIGPPLAMAFAELAGQAADSQMVLACVETYRARYADISLRKTRVVAGIPGALIELATRYRLAVATSKPLAFAEPLLQVLGLREHFGSVTGPDLSARVEDKAATIAAALKALRSSQAIMVGDRCFDIVGAHAHRLAAVGVTWGIGSIDELRSAGADAIIDDPHELAPTVAGLLRHRA